MSDPFDIFGDESKYNSEQEAIDDIKDSLAGVEVDAGQIALIAGFADLAVKAAVEELCAMARQLGVGSVPVQVLKVYAEEQSVASQILWQVAELSGADLVVPDVTVPDDLSGLDGE